MMVAWAKEGFQKERTWGLGMVSDTLQLENAGSSGGVANSGREEERKQISE